jgi:hypothetical protein
MEEVAVCNVISCESDATIESDCRGRFSKSKNLRRLVEIGRNILHQYTTTFRSDANNAGIET